MARLKYHDPHRHATWLELFFDLVFVACIGVITHHLAHAHDGHLDRRQLLLFPLEFIPVWWIWATHTLYANRFDTDDKAHRLASLAVMLLTVSMSAFLGSGLSGGSGRFIGIYIAIRGVLAGLFFAARGRLDGTEAYARGMGWTVVAGMAIAAASLAFEAPFRQVVFLAAIAVEMVASVVVGGRRTEVGVHREHLVERVGLLSIILLGESIISLAAGLRGMTWTALRLTGAMSGFVLIGAIWWIYFDTFDRLGRARRMRHGFWLLYSQLFFALGLGLLASVVGHTIRNDIGMADFRILVITGMTLFYLGKQVPYYVVFPVFRVNILVNTFVCIAVTIASTFLPRLEHALIGATAGLIFYVFSNYRWTLPKDVTPYLEEADE